ncbi:MAG: hypothetical protein AB1813_11040 [Verrucomicrobiota bacterium]
MKFSRVFSFCLISLQVGLWAHPPAGILTDEKGHLFVVTFAYNSVLKCDAEGGVATFFSDASGELLARPHHLFRDSQGNLMTAGDSGQSLIRIGSNGLASKMPLKGSAASTSIGHGGDPFAIDVEGNIYCVNHEEAKWPSQILKITPAGEVRVFAGARTEGFVDGTGEKARFGNLHCATMAFGRDGKMYVTDHLCRVRKIASDGSVTTLAGGAEPGFANGAGLSARFRSAWGLALAADGTVYVAELEGHRIRKITAQGVVTTLAGTGQRGYADGPGARAMFEEPGGVAVGPGGEVFVMESIAEVPRIRKIARDGFVTTVVKPRPLK